VKVLVNSQYRVRLIGIDQASNWYKLESIEQLNTASESLSVEQCLDGIDVVFNLIHGEFGEDGTLQGLLDVLKIPYVGASRAGAHNSFDKEITYLMLKENGIRVVPTKILRKPIAQFKKLSQELSSPLFIKPALAGSSIGTAIVHNQGELDTALICAFKISKKVLVQAYIRGREIECSVVGKRSSRVSEIIPSSTYYDFNEKYNQGSDAELVCPARISPDIERQIQACALRACEILDSQGMSRVDFFVTEGDIFVNEVNAIPGFTQISLFVKMFEASGISTLSLVDILVQEALKSSSVLQKL
jgi:D-alanine-D-alanine ligase